MNRGRLTRLALVAERIALHLGSAEPGRPDRDPGLARLVRTRLDDEVLSNTVFGALTAAANRAPATIPRLNRFSAVALSERRYSDLAHRVFTTPRTVRFKEMEYAVPREHAADAVRGARAILERHPVNFPVELRFVADDDALLSPAHGRDTAYVAVHVFKGMDGERPFREVERLMAGWGGRPHWGKRSFLSARELKTRYPAWEAFAAARAELDPDGRFENPWARRTLGHSAQRKAQPSPR